MTAKHESVEAYLAALPDDRRSRLEQIRSIVRAEAPDAVEQIAYDMPAYKLDGRFLVSIGAYAKHDSVFPASRVVVDTLGEELAPHVKGRGTLQFRYPAPLPLDLVRRVVRARVAELAAEPGVS